MEGLLFHYEGNSNSDVWPKAVSRFENAYNAFGLNGQVQINDVPNKEDMLMCLKYYISNLLKIHNETKDEALLTKAEEINQNSIRIWEEIHTTYKPENINQNLAIYGLIPHEETFAILMRKKQSSETIKKAFVANQKLKYYRLSDKPTAEQNISIEELQNKLNPNQIFLDFHVSQSNELVYIFHITSHGFKIQSVPYQESYKLIDEYLNSILEIDYLTYIKAASQLAQTLFPKGITKKEIIVCPYDKFNLL